MPTGVQRSILVSSTGKITDFNSTVLGPGSNSTPGFLAGLLGAIFTFHTDAQAAKYTTSQTTYPLYAGDVQIVKVKSGVTLAFGELLYWSDQANREVTNVPTSAQCCGVAVCQVGTAGSYVHMAVPKVGNSVAMKFVDSPTKTTPAIGDIASTSSTNGRADVLADATAFSGSNLRPVGKLQAAIDGTSHLAKVSFELFG